MTLQASWVHGNSVALQYPGGGGAADWTSNPPSRMENVTDADQQHAWTDQFGLRKGNGATFRGRSGQSNWFHFSIPTPVIFNDARVQLLRVFVLFNSEPGVEVDLVAAFDGPNNIALAMDRPSGLSGRHDGTAGLADLADGETRFPTSQNPSIFWGVDFSVHVSFHVDGNITFTTAGADFLTP
jgi:hypothetical protein